MRFKPASGGLPDDPLVSVVMPVYNEPNTIHEIVRRIEKSAVRKEIIAVDDRSTDGTTAILEEMARAGRIRLFQHKNNMGKGAAVRTGLKQVKGDIVIIQDADLEYDPSEYPQLIAPILKGRSKVVYGSRFLGEHKAMYFSHLVFNQLAQLAGECAVRHHADRHGNLLQSVHRRYCPAPANSLNRWGIDPEITAKILRMGNRIYEVPISYTGREHWEGKKISWRDGLSVIMALIRYRFVD